MADAARKLLTYADYLAVADDETEKVEFFDGQLYAMAGGTLEHARLTMAVGAALTQALRGRPCRTFSPDLRIRVGDEAFYPDLSVICGPPQTHPDDPRGATNPTVLVEVLSPSTERHDRGAKFYRYQQIESLQHYVLVHPELRRVDHFRRGDQGWVYELLDLDQALNLHAVGVTVPLGPLFEDALSA